MFLRDTSDILDRIAIVDSNETQLTYGQLENMTVEYNRIIPTRSLVMILCDYQIDTVSFYYCQMNSHVVPILVDPKLEEELLCCLIETYEPEYIWCSPKMVDVLLRFRKSYVYQTEQHIIIKTKYESFEFDPELALLMTTSGSTGSSKMVCMSYENLRVNMSDFVRRIELQMDDRAITTLPMFYCYGLSILHMHWLVGATIYITDDSLLNVRFWEFFEKSKITNFPGVPYVYDILLQIGFFDKNYPSLRFLTQAGAKLSEDKQIYIAKKLMEKNIRFYLVYGQTEATTYISVLDYRKALDKLGSVGTALSSLAVFIREPKKDGIGELVCKGKSVSQGYAEKKEDLLECKRNYEVLETGDLAYIDGDGDIFLKGRSKRFVKILGARISLDEMEQILNQHYSENEFVCVGIDNHVKICYMGNKLMERDVITFCVKKFNLKKSMLECKKVDSFLRTSTGKLQYQSLLQI